MQEQPPSVEPEVIDSISDDGEARLEAKRKKRQRTEKIGFAIMILGFATLLIPNPTTGKYGEYTMFAGAMMYFSGRLIK